MGRGENFLVLLAVHLCSCLFLLLRCLHPRLHLRRLNPDPRLLPQPGSVGEVDQPHPGSYMQRYAPVVRLLQNEMEASPGSALYHVSSAFALIQTYQVVVKARLIPPNSRIDTNIPQPLPGSTTRDTKT